VGDEPGSDFRPRLAPSYHFQADSARHARMKVTLLIIVAGCCLILPSAALSQLISETVQGGKRVCTYASSTGGTNDPERLRHHVVGFGENCPGTFTVPDPNTPAPPTASLSSEQIAGATRTCRYEQAGQDWSYDIPLGHYCPPSAGMIERDLANPNPRS
jgi:hypothetical protein